MLFAELIRESKLSTFQRKKVEESVKKGEPLPLPPSKTTRGIVHNNNQALGNAQIKCCIPRRRKKEVIQQSGAYEREMFTPTYDKGRILFKGIYFLSAVVFLCCCNCTYIYTAAE